MQAWFEFYALMGGVAATLMGLLFVAVSLNAAAILNDEHSSSKHFAEQAFQNYISVLLVSLIALFPSVTVSGFGTVALGLTAVSAIWVLVRLYLVLTKPHGAGSLVQSLRRQILSLLGFGMLIFSALRMALNWGDSRESFAVSTVILLVAATRVSWQLLLLIAKTKPAGPGG